MCQIISRSIYFKHSSMNADTSENVVFSCWIFGDLFMRQYFMAAQPSFLKMNWINYTSLGLQLMKLQILHALICYLSNLRTASLASYRDGLHCRWSISIACLRVDCYNCFFLDNKKRKWQIYYLIWLENFLINSFTKWWNMTCLCEVSQVSCWVVPSWEEGFHKIC